MAYVIKLEHKCDGMQAPHRATAWIQLGVKSYPEETIDFDIDTYGRATLYISSEASMGNAPEVVFVADADQISGLFHGSHVKRFCEIWKRWSGNTFRRGCRIQNETMRALGLAPESVGTEEAIEFLKAAGGYEILKPSGKMFQYGSYSLFEIIPDEVIAELKQLIADLGGVEVK